MQFFKFASISKYLIYYVYGLRYTLKLAVCVIILGILSGIIFGLMRVSRNKILSMFSAAYVNFIRGTPMLVQVYIVYYGLNLNISSFMAGVIALTVHSSAYIAEIVRSGIQAVDKGQMEAARSLGQSHSQGMLLVVIPQAIKNILPALCNEFIVVIKNTSIVSVIGIQELMYNTDTIRSLTYLSFEPLIIVAVIYFILTYIIKQLVAIFERRLKASD